jgi:TonB family protein
MQTKIFVLLMVTMSLLQCDNLLTKESNSFNQNTQVSSNLQSIIEDDPCDFSLYSPIRIKHFDSDAIKKKVASKYPEEAIKNNIEGRVVVKALVSEDGNVMKVCGVEGEKILQEATIKAVRDWQFKPGYGFVFSPSKENSKRKSFIEVYIVEDFNISNKEK